MIPTPIGVFLIFLLIYVPSMLITHLLIYMNRGWWKIPNLNEDDLFSVTFVPIANIIGLAIYSSMLIDGGLVSLKMKRYKKFLLHEVDS